MADDKRISHPIFGAFVFNTRIRYEYIIHQKGDKTIVSYILFIKGVITRLAIYIITVINSPRSQILKHSPYPEHHNQLQNFVLMKYNV